MRRRLISGTGLGNPDPVILDNKGKLNKEFAAEVLALYFDEFGGFDFKVTKDRVLIGIEPSYQYEKLRIICIDKKIEDSFVHYGKAFGPYGTKIVGPLKKYSSYKVNGKFKKLVDKFHPILFGKDK